MILTRDNTSEKGTEGTLVVNGTTYYTLEPMYRNNTPSISCIPEGYYTVFPHHSPNFGECFRLIGGTVGSITGHRFQILIHAGNWRTNTEGCILAGLSRGYDEAKGLPAVWDSRKALNALRDTIRTPTELLIQWG
jgi:hypothetical protein